MKTQRELCTLFAGVGVLLLLAITDIAAASASLNDYWNGKASWKYVNKWTESSLGSDTLLDGIHIEVVGNDWYLFTRKKFPGNKMGTEVRHSANQGWNWSAPVNVIEPEPGTPWEYAATDGQPFYDSDSNRWHYIFQCTKEDVRLGKWNGCYAYKDGRNPMGYWEAPNKTAPLITGGSLWGKICQSGDSCYQGSGKTLTDEGTFGSFIEGDTVWISFHGHNGAATKSFRGLVKTHKDHIADRSQWIIVANDVPNDAILRSRDGTPWREQWGNSLVGPGHGSILKDGGYYYILPEIVNNHLGGEVTQGQKWDIGLLRTTNLASTTWAQLKDSTGEYQNPVLYSSWPPLNVKPSEGSPYQLLTLQYPRLFKDAAGAIYMIVARNYCNYNEVAENDIGTCSNGKNRDVSAIYLYKLEGKGSRPNILKNGDLWIAADSYWHQRNKSDMVIYRRFWLASDGNQFMQFNCGAACQDGASIYQDVNIADA